MTARPADHEGGRNQGRIGDSFEKDGAAGLDAQHGPTCRSDRSRGSRREGTEAISWTGAIVWGLAATLVFTAFSMMGKAMGMTRMDLLDLLGSSMMQPGTPRSRLVGAVVHLANGAVLAIAWVYGVTLIDASADWVAGAIWGVIIWAVALLMMSTIGSVHPAIRKGQQEDPGPAATNFGKMTPVGSLLGHVVYGNVGLSLVSIQKELVTAHRLPPTSSAREI